MYWQIGCGASGIGGNIGKGLTQRTQRRSTFAKYAQGRQRARRRGERQVKENVEKILEVEVFRLSPVKTTGVPTPDLIG